MDPTSAGVATSAQAWIAAAIAFLPRLGLAVLVFAALWVLAAVARRVTLAGLRGMPASRADVARLLGSAVYASGLVLAVIVALGTVGVNVTAAVAGLGLVGFALGYALKDAVTNLLAGVLVILYQPFRVGDTIEVSGMAGRIAAIDFRYTTLETERARILVPNGSLLSNAVTVNHATAQATQGGPQGVSGATRSQ